MNIVALTVQDDTIQKLLELVAKVRNGSVIGVTVVTTDSSGAVEMATLSVPVPNPARQQTA